LITPLVFSRDRPAQLDLLLRSLERNGSDLFDRPTVLAKWSDHHFYRAYEECLADHSVEFLAEYDFEAQVRALAVRQPWFCALCDDNVLYRDVAAFEADPLALLLADEEVLCFSLRLGMNTQVCYPMSERQELGAMVPNADALSWDWRAAQGDLGYPASLDGHIFRRATIARALEVAPFHNPNTLEDVLVAGLRYSRRRRMASLFVSALVGVPLNRTATTHTSNRVAEIPGCSPAEMNERFLAGERLSLATVDPARVDGAHCEFEPVWEKRGSEIPKKIAAGSGRSA
jgi:hypothetical protein